MTWVKWMGSFIIHSPMSSPQNLSIHFEFFHKIPTNAITMHPVGSFQKTHKKLTLLLNFRIKCESVGVCCCYFENDIHPWFVLINDHPTLNLRLMSRRSFCYRLYDSPSTSSSLSPLGPGSRETSSPIPDSNASHNSSIALPVRIPSTRPSLQTGFEAPQPSPADSVSSLEAPMLEDVSSSSDEDSGGDLWGTPPSGGAGEDRV